MRYNNNFFYIWLIGYVVNPLEEFLYAIFTFESELHIVSVSFCAYKMS